MKILHIITGLDAHGAETALCRLIESLRPPSFEHIVVALGSEAALSERVRAAGAQLTHLNINAARPNPLALLRLRQILHARRPAVVHGWMYHANLAATLAAWGQHVPLVWGIRQTLYDLGKEKRGTRMIIRANARLSCRPYRIIYNSAVSAVQHQNHGFAHSRTLIIPNGYDTNAFKPDPDARVVIRQALDVPCDALAIGLVARVHPMKDHENFFRAAARFTVDHPRTIFILVGDGIGENNLELASLIESLHLREHVRLCGPRNDIAAVDAALDIAVSSSAWGEGFPNAIAEAMACGVPCVATDVGDVREIIGDTGAVVPPCDPVALSDGLARLAVLDEEGRGELGLRARARIAERYALASVAKQYADFYRGLAQSKGCAVKSSKG